MNPPTFLSCPNVQRKRRMISNGGDLLFVRKTHVIDNLSSTMRRYKLYPS
jgi:hypothetical protein